MACFDVPPAVTEMDEPGMNEPVIGVGNITTTAGLVTRIPPAVAFEVLVVAGDTVIVL